MITNMKGIQIFSQIGYICKLNVHNFPLNFHNFVQSRNSNFTTYSEYLST